MNWFLVAVKQKYADFTGRATRSEYWYFVLFYLLLSAGLMIVDALLGWFNSELGIGVLSGIYTLALMIPSLSVTVRRLHDTGRSAWWLLLGLIPLIGGIVLLVFFVQDSQDGANGYGLTPKSHWRRHAVHEAQRREGPNMNELYGGRLKSLFYRYSGLAVVGLAVIWLVLNSWTTVKPGHRGVVLLFGKVQPSRTGAWIPLHQSVDGRSASQCATPGGHIQGGRREP